MNEMEKQQRERVVREAVSWLRTPYVSGARIRGAGVDCAMLSAEVYSAAQLIPRPDPGTYPPDWHLHRSQEKYLQWVLKYATVIDGPGGVGDKVLFKFGRCFSHGGIIVQWPRIIHAYLNRPVQYEDVTQSHLLRFMGEADNRPRPMLFATLWPTDEQRLKENDVLAKFGLPGRSP